MKYIISNKVNVTSRVRLLIRRRADDKLGYNKREQMRGRVGDRGGDTERLARILKRPSAIFVPPWHIIASHCSPVTGWTVRTFSPPHSPYNWTLFFMQDVIRGPGEKE